MNRLNHEAAITPVTDGENVYVFFKDFGFVSYDTSGKLRWKTPLGPFTNMQGLSASPIIGGDFAILVADQWENSYIAAFSLSSGEMRWRVARDEAESWGTPVLYQAPGAAGQIVTMSRGEEGKVSVLRAAGEWEALAVNELAECCYATPALSGGVIYLRTEEALYAFSASK
jgi:outer membrane protein assembly factor BamB